jgi:hypothetical protein
VEAFSEALTVAVASLLMVPAVALKFCDVPPAGTRILAGTVTSAEFELMVTVVFGVAGPDKIAVHTLVLPDVTVFGEQVTELTNKPANSWIAADAEDPLYAALTDPV